jgi:hypothetical protein
MAARRRAIATRRGTPALLPIIAVSLIAAGCGSGDGGAPNSGPANPATDVEQGEPLGEETAGSVAQLAQCRDWNRGDEAEKLATIADIRSQVNRPDSGFEAPPLSDAEALELFNAACAAPYAQGFRLYILYARGASTAPLVREEAAGG